MPSVDIRDVLPHSGEMVLLDEIASQHERGMVALTTIRESSPFFRAATDPLMGGVAGVPTWVGLEYMAQAVAAWSGLRARAKGERPPSGFLLGSKKFQAKKAVFPLAHQLRIEVTLQDTHGSLALFDCIIQADDVEVEAVLSVYEGELPSQSQSPSGAGV